MTDLTGKYVIARCNNAGVHAGTLVSRNGNECTLSAARRLWYWKVANKGAFLSGMAVEGVDHKASKIGAPVDIVLTEVCEYISCSEKAASSIADAPTYVAQ